LGSGKTTLINHILHGQHGCKIAVIENEFGEISIDSQLVETKGQEQLIEFNNGCLCCTVRGDLIRTLDNLTKRANLEAVLIETTGLADLAPVVSTFFIADDIKPRFSIDASVTMVDACNIERNLRDSNEAQEQVAFSDVILINKADLVSSEELKLVEQRVRSLNPIAKIHHTEFGVIDLSHVFGISAFQRGSQAADFDQSRELLRCPSGYRSFGPDIGKGRRQCRPGCNRLRIEPFVAQFLQLGKVLALRAQCRSG
jgi:G3E family GTPase